MLNSLLQQAVVGFEMEVFSKFKLNLFVLIVALFVSVFHANAENQVKLRIGKGKVM